MGGLLQAEAYYLRKDSMFRGISVLFLIASITLAIWLGAKTGFAISSAAEPLTLLIPLSLFLYFIIPMYVCFFATEGYEYGSIKVILAGGQSRFIYIAGKYITAIKAGIWWILQFYAVFYVVYLSAAAIAGSDMGGGDPYPDLISFLQATGFNILYLSAYAAVILLAGVLLKRTAPAVVATFLIVFGDFLISGYLRDSPVSVLKMMSGYTLTTQIMKFSGVYVANSEHVVLEGARDYLEVLLIPLPMIAACLFITGLLFVKRDIHT